MTGVQTCALPIYNYQPFNKLTNTATASYVYDNNGNLTSKTDALGTTTFTWNEENQLTQVTLPVGLSVNYKYDATGHLLGTNTSSSWRAGVNNALPGFFMPADLKPGFHYYQEFAPFDGANDEGQTLTTHRTQSTVLDNYTDVLAVLETAGSGARGIKYYALGIGLIAEETGTSLDFQSNTGRIELVGVSAVPVPAALPLLGSALGFLSFRRRKQTA